MSADSYQRTIRALPNDTLDAIAHRVYASRSTNILPKLIEANAEYAPTAILPYAALIVLPDDNATAAAHSIKLWD